MFDFYIDDEFFAKAEQMLNKDGELSSKCPDELLTDAIGATETYTETSGCDDARQTILEYTVDEKGKLLDFNATGKVLECEGITSSGHGECLPDYYDVDSFFEDQMDEYEDCDE